MEIKKSIRELRKYLINDTNLWQNNLLSAQDLNKFAREKGVGGLSEDAIKRFWSLALLRSDLIVSKVELHIEGLEKVKEEGENFYYLDERIPEHRTQGYRNSFADTESLNDLTLFFHPFRFFVLYHIQRIFSLDISKSQYFMNDSGFSKIIEFQLSSYNKFSSEKKFCELFDKWNSISELAISLEPDSYLKVFSSIKWKLGETQESIRNKIESYREKIFSTLNQDHLEIAEEWRNDLCISAEQIDENKILHVLLRLTSWHKRQNLKGDIGASLVLLSMAEVIRRSFERTLSISLPEEDQLGFGQWMTGARKIMYGAERVFDSPNTQLRDFLSEIGLDFGTRIKCYVEGDTEYGALDYAIGGFTSVELINLRGNVCSKGALSFVDSLKSDKDNGVFTFVVIDGDREDSVRAIKKAAKDDLISGGYFISNPDIEYQNFNSDELIKIIRFLIDKKNASSILSQELVQAVLKSENAKDFFKAINAHFIEFNQFSKGKAWGEALMEYALLHKPECHMAKMAQKIIHAKNVKFFYSKEKMRIDPNSGGAVSRSD